MAVISPGTVSAAESVPGWLAPPDRMLNQDLAGLDDRELLEHRPVVATGQPAACGGVRVAGHPPPEPGPVLRATVPEQP